MDLRAVSCFSSAHSSIAFITWESVPHSLCWVKLQRISSCHGQFTRSSQKLYADQNEYIIITWKGMTRKLNTCMCYATRLNTYTRTHSHRAKHEPIIDLVRLQMHFFDVPCVYTQCIDYYGNNIHNNEGSLRKRLDGEFGSVFQVSLTRLVFFLKKEEVSCKEIRDMGIIMVQKRETQKSSIQVL